MGQKALKVSHVSTDVGLPQSILDYLGMKMPYDLEFEEAVLGAVLLEKSAIHRIKHIITSQKVFYLEKHQTIWSIAIELSKKAGFEIDILTVAQEARKKGVLFSEVHADTEEFKSLSRKKQEHLLNYGVSAAYIANLSNKIGSAANIEHHSRVLYEQYMRRVAITESFETIKKAQNFERDIFETYDTVLKKFRASNPSSVLVRKNMNQVMDDGEKEPETKKIVGNLIKERQVNILFSDPGVGKSVFLFQIADVVSKGKTLWDREEFKNECEPKKVSLYDFELEDNEIYSRYSIRDKGRSEKYKFSDNFLRYSINPDFLDFEDADDRFVAEIKATIEIDKPELVVIDNITYIASESTDPTISAKLMKQLLALQKAYPPLTIVVIAHTPKRDISLPIELKHLAGAKSLSNFAKSIIAISKSRIDENFRYIINLKNRNAELEFGSDNVIEVSIEKEGAQLLYAFKGFGTETSHLMINQVDEDLKEDAIAWAAKERDKGVSWRKLEDEIKAEYGIRMSFSTIRREVKKYKENSLDGI